MLSAVQEQLQLAGTPYTLARVAAWILAVALVVVLGRRQGISAKSTLGLAATCIPASILGARMLDALEYAAAYPSLGAALARNGSSIYGGLALVFGVVALWAARLRVPTERLLDAAAPSIALGEAVSRVGCFLGGCCYGVPWTGPWAVTFSRETFAFRDQVARGLLSPAAERTLAVHPVQLYSAGLALLMTVWLVRAFLRRRADGDVFYRFLVGYGCLRLAMAPFRMEALGSMKLFSVAFIVVGTAALVAGSRSAGRVGRAMKAA